MSLASPISRSLAQVRSELDGLSKRVGRGYSLIAVSKGRSVSEIEEAIQAGQRDFGESYLQEARLKVETFLNKKEEASLLQASSGASFLNSAPQAAVQNLPPQGFTQVGHADPSLTWHFIGKIQGNKIKDIALYFQVVHSLDCLVHTQKLNEACADLNKKMDVFIQVNLSQEPQKGGVLAQNLPAFMQAVQDMPHLNLIGLMLIPKAGQEEGFLRKDFQAASRHLQENQLHGGPHFRSLSMGMSADYALAFAEGATHLRIGRGVFGLSML